MTILDKVPLQSIMNAQKPIEHASGLPNAAYADADLFEFERDHVFSTTWAALEYASQLPQQGFAKPVQFMGLPLLLIRGADDEIKVFHNVCSHRGMILVPEAGPVAKLIRCRYHSWSYELNGRLKSTPHIGGVGQHQTAGFDRSVNGLKEVRSSTWMGIVFINLSGDAIDFDEFIEPLVSRWEAFAGKGGFDQLQVADTNSNMDLTIAANWKLAIENYCEAYHLPWVHPGLNSYSPLEQHVNLQVNDYMSGQGTLNYSRTEVDGDILPRFPQWPAHKVTHGEYISLFPNVLLGLQVDHTFSIILQPEAADKTVEKLQINYVGAAALEQELEPCRRAVMAAW